MLASGYSSLSWIAVDDKSVYFAVSDVQPKGSVYRVAK